jgi:hypothetical protein
VDSSEIYTAHVIAPEPQRNSQRHATADKAILAQRIDLVAVEPGADPHLTRLGLFNDNELSLRPGASVCAWHALG